MSPVALGLLLLAAAMHAGWNLMVKRAAEKQIFTWWAMVFGSLCFLPLLLLGQPLPLRVWPYVLSSAAVEALYYLALTRAYTLGDFSLVYPLARGSAPAFLLLWTTLFLGEHARPMGYVGLALLILGLLIVGSSTLWAQRDKATLKSVSIKAILIALAVACCISIYTTIDGAAVQFAPSTPYTVCIIGLSAIFSAPGVLLYYGRRSVVAELRVNWLPILVVGIAMLLTYLLVLHAYTLSQVNYAGSVREISVVFAALAGWLWLGEKFGPLRITGSAIIFTGILVIAVAG
jgi:drug/metabolite transporter (DMT)-like permease